MRSLKTRSGKIIKPYSYQSTSFKVVVSALVRYGRALLVMATGLGKTITAIFVLLHFIRPKNRVLFLCHDTGILDQAYKDFEDFFGDVYSFTKFYGKKKDWEADTHNFVFATFQSLAAHLKDKRKKNIFSRKHFDYIIVDEGHHAKAETYESVLEYFIPKWKLALTATPEREDEEDISEIFGKPVVRIELPEGIANGWLTPVDYRILSDGLDDEKIQKLVADVLEDNVRITEKQINERVFVRIRTQEQVKEILKESKKKQAIVFCSNITHLRHVAEFLPHSVWIHSGQTDDENDEAMRAFRRKKARHILVVDKFNEGIDIPEVELLVFLRGTDSRRIFLQQLGRGLRKFPGKHKVTILDFVGNIRRIHEVKELVRLIEGFRPNGGPREQDDFTPIHVEGTGFSFTFTSQITDLLKVFDRSQQDPYPTWKEASIITTRMGIKSRSEYRKKYKKDPRLPYNPEDYQKFPGWPIFLGKESASKGWKNIRNIAGRSGNHYKRIKIISDSYRTNHPAWFRKFWTRSGFTEFFHPNLVRIIKKELKNKKIKPTKPKGWVAITILTKKVGRRRVTVQGFLQTLKKRNSDSFGKFWDGSSFRECCAPDIVKIVLKKLKK